MAAVAVASLLVSAGSAVDSHQQQKKAQSSMEKRAKIEDRKARLQNAREARKATANAAQQIAQVQASNAANSGISSTGSTNTISAITGQTASNIGFQQQLTNLSSQQMNLANDAAKFQGRAATSQAIGALPGQLGLGFGDVLANGSGMKQGFKDLFN